MRSQGCGEISIQIELCLATKWRSRDGQRWISPTIFNIILDLKRLRPRWLALVLRPLLRKTVVLPSSSTYSPRHGTASQDWTHGLPTYGAWKIPPTQERWPPSG